jgi:hypothetical protein
MKLKILVLVTLLNSFYLQAMAVELDNSLIEDIDTTNDLPCYHILHGKQQLEPYMKFSIPELWNKAINEQDQNARELFIRKRVYDFIPEDGCKIIQWQDLLPTTDFDKLSNQEVFIIIAEFPQESLEPDFQQKVKERAKKEDHEALYNLGYTYEYGWGVHKNIEKAKKYYKKAAAQGNMHAIYCYAYLNWPFSNFKRTTKILAEQGYAPALHYLGHIYEYNRCHKKALKCYKEAAAQGYINAKYIVDKKEARTLNKRSKKNR